MNADLRWGLRVGVQGRELSFNGSAGLTALCSYVDKVFRPGPRPVSLVLQVSRGVGATDELQAR
jgi:hypothetical protein